MEEEPLMGLRQYQQSGLQYNQYNGQYNVPPGQAAGRAKDNFTIRMLMSVQLLFIIMVVWA